MGHVAVFRVGDFVCVGHALFRVGDFVCVGHVAVLRVGDFHRDKDVHINLPHF